MSKKIQIGVKPTTKPTTIADADAWVKDRVAGDGEKMKRLTIDVSVDLHRAIKSQYAMRGAKIADEVRELLIQKYGMS